MKWLKYNFSYFAGSALDLRMHTHRLWMFRPLNPKANAMCNQTKLVWFRFQLKRRIFLSMYGWAENEFNVFITLEQADLSKVIYWGHIYVGPMRAGQWKRASWLEQGDLWRSYICRTYESRAMKESKPTWARWFMEVIYM